MSPTQSDKTFDNYYNGQGLEFLDNFDFGGNSCLRHVNQECQTRSGVISNLYGSEQKVDHLFRACDGGLFLGKHHATQSLMLKCPLN